jgi:hypothetical protein
MRFSGALGYFGVIGGVVIALGLPWLMLLYGQDLPVWVRPTVIILALLLGGLLAAASVVVGITIPSALKSDKLQIGSCCSHEPASTDEEASETRVDPRGA